MKRVLRLRHAAALFVAASVLAAVPEYDALRSARPDGRQTQVTNLVLERDAYRLTFSSGTMHLLAPANGKTFGAVFIGKGALELTPAVENERRHLALVTGDKTLSTFTDEFESMVLLFSDGSAAEIEKHAAASQKTPDARALQLYEKHLEMQRREYQTNLHLRVLYDHLNGGTSGVFLAAVDGKRHAPALLIVDPRGIGGLAPQLTFFGGEEVAYLSFDDQNGGLWYLASLKGSAGNGRGRALAMPADAAHYSIDTTIASNPQIAGVTTIRFTPQIDNLRVLPLQILPKLRLRTAEIDGAKVELIQEDVELGRLARLFKEEVGDADAALVFSAPLAKGREVSVKITYDGREVLRPAGVESFSVRARESWYPNLGTFVDVATYDLTFRYPRKNNLVSVGTLIEEKQVGDQKVSRWESAKPMRVAGFNYGKFEKKSMTDEFSKARVDVYTSKDRSSMAQNAIADGVNTSRVGISYFGTAPYDPLSITEQVEWFFGQSWPSLVFLPPIALTSSTERVMMFGDAAPTAIGDLSAFADSVGPHEVAHQWWGHLVGWQSYRDQWISEGFSDFTAALVLEHTGNRKKYDDFFERSRRQILEKSAGSIVANSDAGAISQGARLSTKASPGASQAMVYRKGSYVLHMLRVMMADNSAKNPDERFIRMMKEFVTTFSGKSPSSLDFQRVVERNMIPQMNLAGNGKMDWYFDQWVHGTTIPKIRSDLTATVTAGGKYRIAGKVWQEGVGPEFRSGVPIYAEFGRDQFGKIGMLPLVGTEPRVIDVEVAMPKAPKRIAANLMHDVLSRE